MPAQQMLRRGISHRFGALSHQRYQWLTTAMRQIGA
ncbi:hypothetical protein JOJ88_001628 [Pantoea cypripedii]|nr:hypothetical protein [Pantoea cypripedii]